MLKRGCKAPGGMDMPVVDSTKRQATNTKCQMQSLGAEGARVEEFQHRTAVVNAHAYVHRHPSYTDLNQKTASEQPRAAVHLVRCCAALLQQQDGAAHMIPVHDTSPTSTGCTLRL